MSNAEIARQGFAAIARGDYAAISDFLDPDVKWHGGSPADGCPEPQADARLDART